jgi:hypothetical protein
MFRLFCFFLLATWGIAEAKLPSHFSLKTAKNYKEIFLEYPEDHPFGMVKMMERDDYTYFYYNDLHGNLVALGKGDADFHQDIVEVYDSHSNFIGIVERTGRALSSSYYNIYDSENRHIASGSMNLLGTRLNFSTLIDDREIALFYRPFFQLIGDYWYTKVNDLHGIDERLLVIVGAVQATLIAKSDPILGT